MKYFFSLFIGLFSFVLYTLEDLDYEVGNELKLDRQFSVVLFHYKNDAIKVIQNRDFYDTPYHFMVDARDLYKIKKGERIKLIESFREGKVFKVQLLNDKPKRNYYFVDFNSLRHYSLVQSPPSSS